MDTSFLLGSQQQGIQLPDPMTQATQGFSLANLASAMSLRQYALLQAQRQDMATRALGQQLPILAAANFSPESVSNAYQNMPPDAAVALQTMLQQREQAQSTIEKTRAEADKNRMEAYTAGNKILSNVASGIVNENRLPTPDEQAYLSGFSQHLAQVAGLPASFVKVPPVGASPAVVGPWIQTLANVGIDAKTRADIQNVLSEVPLHQAQTYESQVKASTLPLDTKARLITANAEAQQAAAKWADITWPKPVIDAALRPLQETRTPTGAYIAPALTAPPSAAAPAPPAPTYSDQVSRQTGGFGIDTPPGAGPNVALQGAGAAPPNTLQSPLLAQARAVADYKAPMPSRTTALGAMVWQEVENINKQLGRPPYDQTLWDQKAKTAESFSGDGTDAQRTLALNVAISHIALGRQLAQALNNNQPQIVNAIYNRLAVESGSPTPTNFNAASQIIGKEIVKAIVPGGGGQGEREAAEQTFSNIQHQNQIGGAFDTYERLLAGQLQGLHRKYSAGMDPLNTGKDDFAKFVSPETATVLSRFSQPGAAAPAATGGTRYAQRPDAAGLAEGTRWLDDNGTTWVIRNRAWQQ